MRALGGVLVLLAASSTGTACPLTCWCTDGGASVWCRARGLAAVPSRLGSPVHL